MEPGPTATALFLDGKSAELVERMSRAAPLCAHGESFGWYIRANGGAP